jgi:hypothetical protein
MLAIAAQTTFAQAFASSSSTGWGASAAYAQNMGWASFTQTASFGNASANASAVSPWSSSHSHVFTNGFSAAFAQATGSPWGSAAYTQTASFGWGSAWAHAWGTP